MTAILEMRGVSKSFSGVQALRDVNFTVEAGQIHALVGENGAGKSTLMKVLSGVYPHGDYEGSIVFDGEERRFRDINDSEALGIIIIHQELALIPLMSIAENIFLSHPPSRLGVIDRDTVYRRTQELLAQVGLTEMPDTLVTDLGVGKQQLVEIAKALVQAGAPVDSRRADRQPERERQRGTAGSPAGIPRPGHRLDPDLAQIVGGRPRRRPDHGAARRPHRRQHRLPGRAGRRGPHHPQHGRSRSRPSLSAAHRHDRRAGVRGRRTGRCIIRSTGNAG